MAQISYYLFRNTELVPIILLIALPILLYLFLKDDNKDTNTINKNDTINILIITLIYGIVSLWKLGTTSFPSTTWQPSSDRQSIILELTDETEFNNTLLIYGEGDNNSNLNSFQLGADEIIISGSNDLSNYQEIVRFNGGSIYQYFETSSEHNYKYIKIESTSINNTISEVGFYSEKLQDFVALSVYEDEYASSIYPATLIIDEQDTLVHDAIYEHQSYFDEIYHVRNAYEIANGQYMYYSVHPLLGTNIMALFIKLFGLSPFVWRLAGVIFGIMMVPLFYLFIKELFSNTIISTLGTTIFTFDFMHITTSRLATLEPFSVFFILLMFYYMLKYYNSSFYEVPLSKQLKYLFLCGLATSLGIATKWTACYAAVGLAILLFSNLYKRYKEYLLAKNTNDDHILKTFPTSFTKTILWCFVFFIFMPIIIYFISFLPDHISRSPYSLKLIWDHNIYMYNYHANLKATHSFQSTWYQWLLNIRPMWYYYKTSGDFTHTIACFSHPILTLLTIPSIIYVIYNVLTKKDSKAWFIIVGFLANLLPWVLLVDRCVFSYHYYPTTLFSTLAIAYAAYKIGLDKIKNRKYLYTLVIIYILIYIIYLPIITGFGTSIGYIRALELLETWSFG